MRSDCKPCKKPLGCDNLADSLGALEREWFYPIQGFSFVINNLVFIPPPIPYTNGVMSITACGGTITITRVVPFGSTQAQKEAIALDMQYEWAWYESQCGSVDTTSGGGSGGNNGGDVVHPPTPPPKVANEAQTCIVPCAGGGGAKTATVPAGTFFFSNQIAANNYAMATACHQASFQPDTDCFPLFIAQDLRACVGTAFSTSLTAIGNPPINWTLGALPPGILASNTFNSYTLILSGTPTVGGNYSVIITATDANGASTTTTITIFIIQITNGPTLPDAAIGSPYSEQLVAVGGVGPYTFSLVGILPPGLTLSPSGLISGTPT